MSCSTWIGKDFAGNSGSMLHPSRLASKGRRGRVYVLSFFAVLWVSVVVWRLASLQITDFERWQDWASRQHIEELTIASERGPIYDRGGRLLAVSVPTNSIYARPKQIRDVPAAAKAISVALGSSPQRVEQQLRSASPFVWIERQVPKVQAEQALKLGIVGLGEIEEARRFYPFNESASAVLGRVGIDGVGLSGIERAYEQRLRGEHSRHVVGRDALGNQIQVGQDADSNFELPKGEPLYLTIDSGIQRIMDEELFEGRKFANSKAAMAIMVDAESGEVLGLSQVPSVNFNSGSVPSGSALKNLVAETVFEPGSIMKPLVAGAAIDRGLAKPTDLFNCEMGRYQVGKHTIKDVHPSGVISLFDVVVRSSNIGMTKVGMRLGADRLYESLRRFGFGEASGLGLPGETRGILRDVKGWAQVDIATHSFGQGVAVTPLQVVRAVSAVANGGVLPNLKLVMHKDDADSEELEGRRVLSPKTAQLVQEMMYGVVENEHGTGKGATIEGVRIGGKTGTAQKARAGGRGYAAGLYVASFVGFADATAIGIDRKLTLLVMIDEPHTGTIYGGTLAAPVFKKIIQRTLHLLSTSTGEQETIRQLPHRTGDLKLTTVAYHAR